MRVIAGSQRGRTLQGPSSSETRPMADRIRQALFSSLGSLGVEPVSVLDLYAGTGSIGIEALSRGADRAIFVDQSHRACQTIRHNLELTGFGDVGTVIRTSVPQFIGRGLGTFDTVFLDPPYADSEIQHTIERLSQSSLVQSDSIVSVGHAPRVQLAGTDRLGLLRTRCHGDSCYSIFEIIATPDGVLSTDAGEPIEDDGEDPDGTVQ